MQAKKEDEIVRKTLQIGVTGGIGTGKSTVCSIFEELGIAIYDADTRAKAIMQEDELLIRQLREAFGEKVYDAQDKLNREYLAQIVFKDSKKIVQLNSLVHPAVGRDYQNWANENYQTSPYLIKEAALMFESGSYRLLDKIIVVYAPLEERIKRVLERDPHRDEAQVKAIINKQMSEEEKLAKADYVIHNDHQHLLKEQVVSLHEEFLKMIQE